MGILLPRKLVLNCPHSITIVRHAQAGETIDAPLSALGERQAKALGLWLAHQPDSFWPDIVISSPYVRARQTIDIATKAFGRKQIKVTYDERLRERDSSIELHSRTENFYYRAPGGENWCDVILRLRSLIESVSREHAGRNVWFCCHSVVVLCFRYIFEELNEESVLAIDKEHRLLNAGVTSYKFNGEKFVLEKFNSVAALEEAGETLTKK